MDEAQACEALVEAAQELLERIYLEGLCYDGLTHKHWLEVVALEEALGPWEVSK